MIEKSDRDFSRHLDEKQTISFHLELSEPWFLYFCKDKSLLFSLTCIPLIQKSRKNFQDSLHDTSFIFKLPKIDLIASMESKTFRIFYHTIHYQQKYSRHILKNSEIKTKISFDLELSEPELSYHSKEYCLLFQMICRLMT